MTKITLLLAVLCIALALHYVSQKMLFKKGLESDNPKNYTSRFLINGAGLIVVALAAVVAAPPPTNLFGLLILVEGAVCIGFAIKLKKAGK